KERTGGGGNVGHYLQLLAGVEVDDDDFLLAGRRDEEASTFGIGGEVVGAAGQMGQRDGLHLVERSALVVRKDRGGDGKDDEQYGRLEHAPPASVIGHCLTR